MSKVDTLSARWSKREKDILFSYPRKVDGALLSLHLCCERPHHAFGSTPPGFNKSLVDELKARGYDITTLRFSIKRLPQEPK